MLSEWIDAAGLILMLVVQCLLIGLMMGEFTEIRTIDHPAPARPSAVP